MAEFTIDVVDTVQRVTARVGDSVWLCLTESPTTGYLWSRTGTLPPNLIERRSEHRRLSPAMGGAAQRCFLYSCLGPLSAEMTFALSRSWEPDKIEREARVLFECTP